MQEPLESPWTEDTGAALVDAEWTKMSSVFINTGYREGITAGKESALQAGFDTGFAEVGAPLGRELGRLRGATSATLSFLTSSAQRHDSMITEVRNIAGQLTNVRLSDISPGDLEADEHSRQHLQSDTCASGYNEMLSEDRRMEGLEDMLSKLTASGESCQTGRPTMDDVKRLNDRLLVLCQDAGLEMKWGRDSG